MTGFLSIYVVDRFTVFEKFEVDESITAT